MKDAYNPNIKGNTVPGGGVGVFFSEKNMFTKNVHRMILGSGCPKVGGGGVPRLGHNPIFYPRPLREERVSSDGLFLLFLLLLFHSSRALFLLGTERFC